MAQNKLMDLNNHLFEAIERLEDDDICKDTESTLSEIKKAHAISVIGKQIIDNNRLQLDIIRAQEELGINSSALPVNLLIGTSNGKA